MATSIITGRATGDGAYDIESTADKITKYSLFAGGLDMTNASSSVYTPLIGGYGRLFMVRKPAFLEKDYAKDLTVFKHILEYGNTGVSGLGDINLEVESMTGGYAGKSVDIATISKDDTTAFQVKVYEFQGSPVRNLLHLWITGIGDPLTGLMTLHGYDAGTDQSCFTAEFIYVVTDRTGQKVEYACMLANCIPKKVPEDHFNYDAGTHSLVQLDLEFTCVKYESVAINVYANRLLQAFKILGNHLNFNPHLDNNDKGDLIVTGVTNGDGTSDGNAPDDAIAGDPSLAPTNKSKNFNLTKGETAT